MYNTISLPGSKSITNRALILSALCSGQTTLINPSTSDDTNKLIIALKQLGIDFIKDRKSLKVLGQAGKFKAFTGELDVGAAGTTFRFLTALLSAIPGSEVILTGTPRLMERPIRPLVESLSLLGAEIQYLGPNQTGPLRILGKQLKSPGSIDISSDLSSQFISSLLLIEPLIVGGAKFKPTNLVSAGYFKMTKELISKFRKNPSIFEIEPDASSASYFFGFAALKNMGIGVNGLSFSSIQPDINFVKLLEQMGCSLSETESGIMVQGTADLKAIEADMSDMPDTALTLAVIAAFASGETKISGLHTLELKESKRLTALTNELKKMGISASHNGDSLCILGGSPHSAKINTYDDHRIAMSFALASARISGIEIDDPSVVSKSFPEFWERLSSLR